MNLRDYYSTSSTRFLQLSQKFKNKGSLMPRKFFDDEFLAKRVWQDFIRRQNSTQGYKLKLKQAIAKNPAIEYKKRIPNSEVVIKITGASRSYEHLKAHLRYISRNGELEISTSDETMSFKGKESLKDLSKSFNRNSHNIPTQSEIDDNCKTPQREVLHIVFSLKECNIFFIAIFVKHKKLIKVFIYHRLKLFLYLLEILVFYGDFLCYTNQISPAFSPALFYVKVPKLECYTIIQ